jgi:phenylalanyl-tRNA synthetase beta chain
MRVPIAWLREYVDVPNDAQVLSDRLAMLGFPVEEIVRRPRISGVVVGKIAALHKHPNADRLQVGSIDVGGPAPLTIATAATNVAQGQVIPVAVIGAKLPHLTIEPRNMRGIASEGMMVSADELGLPPEWFEDGIVQLDPDTPLGADVVELFGLNDDVLDVEVTSNRVDAMSVLGLARELAASYGLPLKVPSFVNPGTQNDPPDAAPQVRLDSPDCTRFVAQRFDHISVGPAPAWMRVRLALAGQRPIDNVVDVSNYVMLETAQPLHFYDAARIPGARFVVRDARDGETMVTLDGTQRTLAPQALVIAGDDAALCLAGLMGGAGSEVTPATTAIVLEAANFNGARIRRTSKALGLRSEASSRHEKTLAPALTDIGAARAAQLLTAIGAHAYRPHAFGASLEAAQPIELTARDVERLLGLTLDGARIASHLEALGCSVTAQEGGALAVVPPAWRLDLTIAADLVEEVARMEGYENIAPVVPSVPAHDISSAQFDAENTVAAALAALGYREIITHTLHGRDFFDRMMRSGFAPSHNSVEVLNPLSEDQRFLRYTLWQGSMAYFSSVDAPARAFEIGHVFALDEGLIGEVPILTFGFAAEPLDEPEGHDTHLLRLKGDGEALLRALTGRRAETARENVNGLHPGKTGMFMMDGRQVAHFGRLDPRAAKAFDVRLPVYLCSVFLDVLPEYVLPRFRPPSKYPSTYRDLAVVVNLDVTAQGIEATLAKALGEICTSIRVFDEYRGAQVGEGRKSLAVRITLQRYDATITDEEADAAIERALDALRREIGATIRG